MTVNEHQTVSSTRHTAPSLCHETAVNIQYGRGGGRSWKHNCTERRHLTVTHHRLKWVCARLMNQLKPQIPGFKLSASCITMDSSSLSYHPSRMRINTGCLEKSLVQSYPRNRSNRTQFLVLPAEPTTARLGEVSGMFHSAAFTLLALPAEKICVKIAYFVPLRI